MPRLYKKRLSSPVATAKMRVVKEREEISPDKARDHLFARVRPCTDDSDGMAKKSQNGIQKGTTTPARPTDRPYHTGSEASSPVTALPSFLSPSTGPYDDSETIQQPLPQLSTQIQDLSNEDMGQSVIRAPLFSHSYQISNEILGDDFYISRPSSQKSKVDHGQAQPELTVLRTTTRLYQVHRLPRSTQTHAETQKGHGTNSQETTQQSWDEQPFPEKSGQKESTLEPLRLQRGELFDYLQRNQSRLRQSKGPIEEGAKDGINNQEETSNEHLKHLDYLQRPNYTSGMQPQPRGVKRRQSEVEDDDSGEDFCCKTEERVLRRTNYLNINPFKAYQYSHARRRPTKMGPR